MSAPSKQTLCPARSAILWARAHVFELDAQVCVFILPANIVGAHRKSNTGSAHCVCCLARIDTGFGWMHVKYIQYIVHGIRPARRQRARHSNQISFSSSCFVGCATSTSVGLSMCVCQSAPRGGRSAVILCPCVPTRFILRIEGTRECE